jgi:hypothetical protein
MKLMKLFALPAVLLTASVAVADPSPHMVLACHVNFTTHENGKPDRQGRSDLYVTVSLENAPNGYLRVITSDPDSIVSFDPFKATGAGLITPQGTFRDVSTSGSWTLNRSLRRADSQEFEEVIINRISRELFYQKQITNKLGAVFYTRTAAGPCADTTSRGGSLKNSMKSTATTAAMTAGTVQMASH